MNVMLPIVWGALLAVIGSLFPASAIATHHTAPATNDDAPPHQFLAAIGFLPRAVEIAVRQLDYVIQAETTQFNNIHKTGHTSAMTSFRMSQKLKGCTPHDKRLSYSSFIQSASLSMIKKRYSLSSAELTELLQYLPDILIKDPSTPVASEALRCPYPTSVSCSPVEIFRTYDGRCNNFRRPLWGSSHQPLVRFLAPDYADAISKPRVARSGKPLPNARLVSSVIHPDVDNPDHVRTLMLMLFGQFLDHDMSKTAISKIAASAKGTELEDVQCGEDGCQTKGLEDRECFSIFCPPNDPVYGGLKHCLKFVRSLPVPNENCDPGPREQINQLTSFLDASHIYGNSKQDALDLRELTFSRGRLRVTNHPAGGYKPLLPVNPDDKECHGDGQTVCFKAGDGRVNEWTGLTTQHMIWVREHNRIEQKLHELNPHWNGERLYQETRRIIIAIWQFTVYNEYLPIIVGDHAMQAYGLQLVTMGYWNGYDDTVNPSIANSFATGAMRFGHTQIQGVIHGRDASYKVIKNITLSTQFFTPHLMYEAPANGVDMMMLGLVGSSVSGHDRFITEQVTRHLFAERPPHGLGEDLASLNIQRGREHGIPGYNWFRQWCGMKKATTFEHLVELPAYVIHQFRQHYEHVDDIDLWPAGIAEHRHNGALLGPTFTCILARQFRNLKFGDRFWFENNFHNPYPFTEAQLTEIRKVRYAKLMCENADSMPTIQPGVFFHPLSVVRTHNPSADETEHIYSHSANERVPCYQLPDINLRPWAENLHSNPAH